MASPTILYYAKDIERITRKNQRTAYRIINKIRENAGLPRGPVVTNIQLAAYLGIPVEHLAQ